MPVIKDLAYYRALPYNIVVTADPTGGYVAHVAELPGVITQAETWAELDLMIKDAMEGWLSIYLEKGYPIPEPDSILTRG